MLKTFTSTIAAGVLTLGLGLSASASPMDHLTKFTFNQPIAVPGVTLPAGTYIFKLADPSTDRKIVQVIDAESMRSYAMLQVMPRYRGDSREAAALTLMNTVDGMPAAVQTWWPLGESMGFDFMYPESQHAKLTGVGPSTITGDGIDAVHAAVEPRVSSPVVPARAVQRVAVSSSQAIPAATAAPAAATADTLPNTASPAALIALIGALTLFGGGFALGRSRA